MAVRAAVTQAAKASACTACARSRLDTYLGRLSSVDDGRSPGAAVQRTAASTQCDAAWNAILTGVDLLESFPTFFNVYDVSAFFIGMSFSDMSSGLEGHA